MSAGDARHRGRDPVRASPRLAGGAASIRRAPRPGAGDHWRGFRTAAASAGRWRPTGPTRSCSSSTRSPSRLRGPDPRRDARRHRRHGRPEFRAFVVVGSALWSIVLAGIAGLAWSVLDDRERYRMLKYVYVSPSDFMVVLLGRGVARLAVGAMGASSRSASGSCSSASRSTRRPSTGRCFVVVMALGLVPIVAIGVLLAAICLQTRQESWSYPEAVAGALFLVSGVVFPLSVLPLVAPGGRPAQPADLVDRGRSRRDVPGGRRRSAGRQPVDRPHRQLGARRHDHRRRLAGDRCARYTRGHDDLPGQRAPRQGSRALDRTTGS